MPVVRSPGKYPRKDSYFKTKSSLNFDMMRSRIISKRGGDEKEAIILWVTHIACGIFCGVGAFVLIYFEDVLTHWRCSTVQTLIDKRNDLLWASYLFYVFTAILFTVIAACLVLYVAPGAKASGVAECIAMLNGVNYPNTVSFATLWVKFVGTLFAVCGGLCIGKEGPLVHMGAIVGIICCYSPFKWSEYMQNDLRKR